MQTLKTAGRCVRTPPSLPISTSRSTAVRCEGARTNASAACSTSVGGFRAVPLANDRTRRTRSAAPTLVMMLWANRARRSSASGAARLKSRANETRSLKSTASTVPHRAFDWRTDVGCQGYAVTDDEDTSVAVRWSHPPCGQTSLVILSTIELYPGYMRWARAQVDRCATQELCTHLQ